jgi:hypothetical protein
MALLIDILRACDADPTVQRVRVTGHLPARVREARGRRMIALYDMCNGNIPTKSGRPGTTIADDVSQIIAEQAS